MPIMAKSKTKEKQSRKTSQQPCHLLRLPLEIRTLILRALLEMPNPVLIADSLTLYHDSLRLSYHVQKDPAPFATTNELIRFYYTEEQHFRTSIAQAPLLAIFSASKALYEEATAVYFGCNTFKFSSLNRFSKFIETVSPLACANLRHLRFTWRGSRPALAAKHLTLCTGLKTLSLRLTSYSFANLRCKILPPGLHLYGMKDLLTIRGLRVLEIEFSALYCDHELRSPPFCVCPTVDGGRDGESEDMGDFRERMEVMKMPREEEEEEGFE